MLVSCSSTPPPPVDPLICELIGTCGCGGGSIKDTSPGLY